MGNQSSTARSPRKDSLHSQDGKYDMEPVKRKPLPKFTSLADLGNGPRGGKGGPLPQPRARKQSLETDAEQERGRTAVRNEAASLPREYTPPKLREQTAPIDAPRIVNPLPPTPKDEPFAAPPPSSKKPFGGMGLPSNPKHRKGKSDTGFDILNNAASPRLQQFPAPPQTITPGPTPTPRKTEMMGSKELVDQAARLSPEVSNSQRRPFSFERVPTLPQLEEPAGKPSTDASLTTAPPPAQAQPSPSVSVSPPADASPLPPPAALPPRSASRQPPPPAFAGLPSQQQSSDDDSDTGMSDDASPDTPPFVPLTEIPVPTSRPPITHKHHGCYSQHATFVWSRNDFQPMACMICDKNDTERRWACVWCHLRICVGCSVELQKTPGRRLQSVLERRAAEAAYAGDAYDEDDEAAMHPGFEGSPAGVNGVNGNGNGKRHDSGNANPSLVVWDADAEDAGERVNFS